MRQYKATKDGILANPYKRVRKGDVVNISGEVKASWLIPLENYKPQAEQVLVPHMTPAPAKEVQTHNIPPAPSSSQYQEGMKNIEAAEAVQDGKADEYNAQKQAQDLAEVAPGTFVGDAVASPAPAPVQAEVAPAPLKPTEGTGNAQVI